MGMIRKTALTGVVMGAALGLGISSASAATTTSTQRLGAPATTRAVTPMHYTSWGWNGVTVYFNHHETATIAVSAGACATYVPEEISKAICGALSLEAALAVANGKCIAVHEPGATIWAETNHHCY